MTRWPAAQMCFSDWAFALTSLRQLSHIGVEVVLWAFRTLCQDLRNGTGQLWAWSRSRLFLPGWHYSGTRDTGRQKRINSPKAFHSEVFLGEKRASSCYSVKHADSGGWEENFQGTGVLRAWTKSLSFFILMERRSGGGKSLPWIILWKWSNLPPTVNFSSSFLCSLKEVGGEEGTTSQAQADKQVLWFSWGLEGCDPLPY